MKSRYPKAATKKNDAVEVPLDADLRRKVRSLRASKVALTWEQVEDISIILFSRLAKLPERADLSRMLRTGVL